MTKENPFLPFLAPLMEQNNKILEVLTELQKTLIKSENKNKGMLSREELARQLSVTLPTIHRLMQKGLKFYKVGRRTLFNPDEVQAFLDSRKIKLN